MKKFVEEMGKDLQTLKAKLADDPECTREWLAEQTGLPESSPIFDFLLN